MDKLNICKKFIWHLAENINGGTVDENGIDLEGVKSKCWNSNMKFKHSQNLGAIYNLP